MFRYLQFFGGEPTCKICLFQLFLIVPQPLLMGALRKSCEDNFSKLKFSVYRFARNVLPKRETSLSACLNIPFDFFQNLLTHCFRSDIHTGFPLYPYRV